MAAHGRRRVPYLARDAAAEPIFDVECFNSGMTCTDSFLVVRAYHQVRTSQAGIKRMPGTLEKRPRGKTPGLYSE